MTKYYLSRYIVFSDTLNPNDSLAGQKCILYSTLSNRILVISEELHRRLEFSEYENLDQSLKNELIHAKILMPEGVDEFAEVLAENRRIPKNLSLMLHPTGGCQSSCSHCMQDQTMVKNASTDLMLKTVEFTRQQLSKGGFEVFRVIWNGGEPLENLFLIEQWSKKNQELSNQWKVPYQASLVTNGYLLGPAEFEKLFKECSVRWFQVTLDGPREQHDHRQIQQGGSPSFDRIFNNLRSILKGGYFTPADGLVFQLNINVDRQNCESIVALIDECANYNFQNRVTFRFSRLVTHSGLKVPKADLLEQGEFAEWEIEYEMHAANKGFVMATIPGRRFEPCFATGAHSYLIDTVGNIQSCSALPYTTNPAAMEEKLGNLFVEDGACRSNNRFRSWFHTLENDKGICYNCNLFPICGGGCRVQWDSNEQGCPSFKYNIKDRLLLNYLNRKSGR